MSNSLTFQILHIILPMLAHDLEIACARLQENRLIIDGEIDEKHTLKKIQNNCVLEYSVLLKLLLGCHSLSVQT